MKKIFVTLSLSLAVVLTAAAHPVSDNNPLVEKAFQKMFAGASHVTWKEVNDGLLKASFVWGERQTVAIFDQKAQLVGTIRSLFSRELPLAVTKSINEHFGTPVVLEANEIYNEEGVRYVLVVEHKDQKYNVDLDSMGYILEKEKRKK